MPLARTALLISFLLLSGCSSVEVRTDHDSAVDFSRYSTYAWKQLPATSYSLMDNRIVALVDGQLTAKGWRRVPEEQAQTVLAARVTYTVGTLVLDLYDTRTHRAIWRGTASDVLWENPKRLKKSVNQGIQEMFDKFPPGVGRVSK